MKSIKSIIVPTDFSSAADTALNFAIKFAQVFESEIILYHLFTPFQGGFYPLIKDNLKIENELLDSLRQIKKRLSHKYKNVPISVHVDRGSGKSPLIAYCQEKKISLIIMGTKGSSGLKSVFLGSYTSNIMKSSKCPVLAIPSVSKFKIPKKITFASNYKPNELVAIKSLLELNKIFNAKIKILHVDKDEKITQLKEIAFNKYRFKIEKLFKGPSLSFKHIGGKDSIEVLLRSILKDKSEMLVISPLKNDGAWDKLFHKSFTKAIVSQIHMPLLSFPS